jgi:dolichol-phosphate hexosyltransferase
VPPALSILMPVYNEAATVVEAVEATLSADLGLDLELIVVNDGSTDGTGDLLAAREWPAEVRMLSHDANRGKGAAVRTALGHASGEISAILDADLEYDPHDLAKLIAPIQEGEANAVFGVRAFEGHTSHSFLYVMGNRGVTLVANLLFNVYLKDLMTCHKAIRTEVFRTLPLQARGFDIEAEIASRLLRRGERIYEMPVEYRARTSDQGKKLTAADGFRVVVRLLRCRLSG